MSLVRQTSGRSHPNSSQIFPRVEEHASCWENKRGPTRSLQSYRQSTLLNNVQQIILSLKLLLKLEILFTETKISKFNLP